MGELLAEKRPESGLGQRKSQVRIPRLSDSVVRSRAESAYTRSVELVVKSSFSSVPARSEILALRTILDRQVRRKPGAALDVDSALKQLARAKPASLIARYYKATGSNDWLDASYSYRTTASGAVSSVSIKLVFLKPKMQAAVRAALLSGKTHFANLAVKLNNPKNRSATLDLASLHKDMPAATANLCANLGKALKQKNGLTHFTLSYSAPELELKSTLKQGIQRFDL